MTSKAAIEVVVFDWGGVLIENPVPGLFAYIQLHFPRVDMELFDGSAMEEFQKGTITEQAFWNAIPRTENVELSKFDGSLWRKAFESCYTERKEVVKYAGILQRNGFRTAILSNTEKPSVEMLKSFDYQVFDETYFSCDWGMVKPDPAIYERCVRALEVEPDRILFVDDKPENIVAAESVGMQGHVMSTIEGFGTRLEALNLPQLG